MNNPIPQELKQVVEDLLSRGFKDEDAIREAEELVEWQESKGDDCE